MLRKVRARLTYANVMSSLAMFILLGGVAYASVPNNSVTTGKIRNGHVRTADIRNNDIRSSDLRTGAVTTSDIANNTVRGPDVDEATLAPVARAASAGAADTANSANHAFTADSAQPRAFALVDGATGTVSRNKGIENANVTHPGPGIYCITGLSFAIQGGQVTTVFTGSVDSGAQFSPGVTGSCPNGGQVRTEVGGVPTDQTFNLHVYG